MHLKDFRKQVSLLGSTVRVKKNPRIHDLHKRIAKVKTPEHINPTAVLNLIKEVVEGGGLWDKAGKILL